MENLNDLLVCAVISSSIEIQISSCDVQVCTNLDNSCYAYCSIPVKEDAIYVYDGYERRYLITDAEMTGGPKRAESQGLSSDVDTQIV